MTAAEHAQRADELMSRDYGDQTEASIESAKGHALTALALTLTGTGQIPTLLEGLRDAIHVVGGAR